ncbi:transglutaminase domain-containing protein [Streptococcus ruminantium]|uniref:Transglutaminase-like domain-containing protein n=1 Tax=Streptococcus ruminantium TaxID=1917441 RepID=A0ABU1B3B4_9STRE|nr:transglutaminase domain-containing protein [Streptococcus ruminantium]MDQ8760015.1 transglutaminase-like domain-containing protein [Streptococcus ruminantium]MDQ8765542.1 transglutaminase-like domain-containing protein [Streptococcus ruminantium]MDQ8769236.1 transglutaminase-like domain-containing protein [Streptococcus ruminantium]MDQ8775151.1 transglutaminase-like domain-containing protein [Streptococcus ruminantium]MDQ8794544.1 transglutaminase-like domain-containing protein [Streptococc
MEQKDYCLVGLVLLGMLFGTTDGVSAEQIYHGSYQSHQTLYDIDETSVMPSRAITSEDHLDANSYYEDEPIILDVERARLERQVQNLRLDHQRTWEALEQQVKQLAQQETTINHLLASRKQTVYGAQQHSLWQGQINAFNNELNRCRELLIAVKAVEESAASLQLQQLNKDVLQSWSHYLATKLQEFEVQSTTLCQTLQQKSRNLIDQLQKAQPVIAQMRPRAQTSFSSNAPYTPAFGNEGFNHRDHRTISEQEFNPSFVDLSATTNLAELKNKMDQAYLLRAKQILFKLDRDMFQGKEQAAVIVDYIKTQLSDMPNIRGVRKGLDWNIVGSRNGRDTYVMITPQYHMSDDQHRIYYRHIKEWVSKNIHSSDNEVTKIDKIQSYIMTNFTYAHTPVTKSGLSIYTPYAFIADKEGVCLAYSQMFKDMGQLAGLEAYYIQGYGDPYMGTNSFHSWNIVKVDGQFYHIDLTWNDAMDSSNRNRMYTLRGNKFMMNNHRWNSKYAISDTDYAFYSR